MTLLDQTIAVLFRKSSSNSALADATFSVDRPMAEAAASEAAASESASEDANTTRVDDQPEVSQDIMAQQISSPWAELDLDTAIRLRWALRDIKGKRTKLTPVSPSDLKTLLKMGLIEVHHEAPLLTNEGHQALQYPARVESQSNDGFRLLSGCGHHRLSDLAPRSRFRADGRYQAAIRSIGLGTDIG
jgi:hypothetical protein